MPRFAPRWAFSFQATESLRDQERAAEQGGDPCSRGDWCTGRTVAVVDGQRIIRPRRTYRAYCDACEDYLGTCAAELADLHQRLLGAIGDPLQAEVHVASPFGPQIPLREDIDAHLRLMGALLPAWEARVRATARLSRPDLEGGRQDSPEAIVRACRTLSVHIGVLLALQPAWMTRSFRTPLDECLAEDLADEEIVRAGQDYVAVMQLRGGLEAGQELQWLHYRARSMLLETNPPPEILIPPCRSCEMRALRRAWPEAGSGRDLYSRCDHCRDEMTGEEYDVNARRWLAYHKAHATAAVLLEAS
jgi:hypothetical protein